MSEASQPSGLDGLIRWGAARLSTSPTASLDARVLAKSAFGFDDAQLIARGSEEPDARGAARFAAMIERRTHDEPVAHITGRREFWSLDLEVEPGILVPRADSETLVEAIVRRRPAKEPLKILDLGCGSGALLCALMSAFPNAAGLGVDLKPAAVALTSRNLRRLGFGGRADAQIGDWFAAIDRRFDVVVANPPYIPSGDRDTLPREVRDFEDADALFAGADGHGAHRRIFADAPARLAADGLLAVEFGEGQATAINELARKALPGGTLSVENDLSGRPRALVIDLRGGKT